MIVLGDVAREGPMDSFCSPNEMELNMFFKSYCVYVEKFCRPHCKHIQI